MKLLRPQFVLEITGVNVHGQCQLWYETYRNLLVSFDLKIRPDNYIKIVRPMAHCKG